MLCEYGTSATARKRANLGGKPYRARDRQDHGHKATPDRRVKPIPLSLALCDVRPWEAGPISRATLETGQDRRNAMSLLFV